MSNAYVVDDYWDDEYCEADAVIVTLSGGAIAAGAPILGTPELSVEIENYALTASGIEYGVPTLGQPSVAQNHGLVGSAIESGLPALGATTLTETDAGTLLPESIVAGNPTVGSPTLTQNHLLSGGAIAAGAPVFGMPTMAQQHAMTATGIVTWAPALGSPSMSNGEPSMSVAMKNDTSPITTSCRVKSTITVKVVS